MDGVPEVDGKERQDASSYEEQIEGPGSHVDYTIEGDEGAMQGTDFLIFGGQLHVKFLFGEKDSEENQAV